MNPPVIWPTVSFIFSSDVRWASPIAVTIRSSSSPQTGEPEAGNQPVRFGGRGEVLSLVPTPIEDGRKSRPDLLALLPVIPAYQHECIRCCTRILG